ncbi:protein MAINTENANCE OF MERISTEMS-like [Papaver somniferum]|uniref:protein MAINTENANCE OF MERISTEMS-like n=1 Tax=Papaver somniferum TaxID=3469 RepID=UPI000E703D6A|nr:protein MAINTENANCE OF MERISTEMS-like [Papaver somniferum]
MQYVNEEVMENKIDNVIEEEEDDEEEQRNEDQGNEEVGQQREHVENVEEEEQGQVRLIKRQKASKWDLTLECDEFQAKVKECVLWRAVEYAHVDFDDVAVSAFLKRNYPETYTMHLPFGEMGITHDDFHSITGLTVEGWDARKDQCGFRRSVRSPKRDDEYNPREANGTLKKKVKKFKLVKSKATFGGTKKKVEKGKLVMDRETLRHHVTAYWLYQLGTVIFPDTSGNWVDAHYLQLLEHLDEMNKYSWATGVLAFVLGG